MECQQPTTVLFPCHVTKGMSLEEKTASSAYLGVYGATIQCVSFKVCMYNICACKVLYRVCGIKYGKYYVRCDYVSHLETVLNIEQFACPIFFVCA